MTEFILHLVTVALTALILVGVFSIVDGFRRKRNKSWQYHITYEYKMLNFSYDKCNDAMEMLNKLGKDGWEIACSAGKDAALVTSLILKRETLHTTKR